MKLNELITKKIMDKYEQLKDEGEILSDDQLNQYYELFKNKFGPEKLLSLSGETLLDIMHDSSNRESLVYWLEFKNDEEFPSGRFGSIAGGSALKFRIYRRAETREWMTGSPTKQITLKLDQAIEVANKHREQLINASKLVNELPENASNDEYIQLQSRIMQVAPDIGDSAWVHKYLSLLFPSKLENFHNQRYQRYHLITLLQLPVSKEGRYSISGQYLEIAKDLGIHPNNFMRILWEINSSPIRYWSVKANLSGYTPPWHYWDIMKNEGFIGIGWKELGDLSNFAPNQESRAKIKELMKTKYNEKGGFAQEIFDFATVIKTGDVILATEKNGHVLGIGKVEDGYFHDSSSAIAHRLKVNWLITEPWDVPVNEINNRVVKEIQNYENLIEIESRLIGITGDQPTGDSPVPPVVSLTGIPSRINNILDRKKQVILYGPPGTGKTYQAYESALNIASLNLYKTEFKYLSSDQVKEITGKENSSGLVQFCTFHPSYGYEDFMEGYKPVSENGELLFKLHNGIFKKICSNAKLNPNKKYILIIDEINRGDIPRIFGELLTLLEVDKRGREILLPISGELFSVPENVYIIGTMNTADRSIALLDTALRRRFGFVELMPDPAILGTTVIEGIPLKMWLEALNKRILQFIGKDARNLQIGHAYFLEKGQPITTLKKFIRVLQDDIIPLLEEYCYEDFESLEKILGKGIVDREKQRIRHDLFTELRTEGLVQALLEPSPEITTTSIAIQQEEIDFDSEGNAEEDD